MSKNKHDQFRGIPNQALRDVILRTMNDAAALQAAGLPLPEFKKVQDEKTKLPPPDGFRLSNAGLGDYLRVSAEITQMAADLRKSKGPKLDF